MYKKKIFGFDDVQKIINNYYKNPEATLKSLGLS